MLAGRLVTACIPARAGSTRVKNKNIRLIAGKPLIYWAIRAAQRCQQVDIVSVSTNSDEIGEIARSFGAEYHKRPDAISTPFSKANELLVEYLDSPDGDRMKSSDVLCMLNPTSPLRRPEHITGALELLTQKQADGVASLSACHPREFTGHLGPEHCLKGVIDPKTVMTRTQDLPTSYIFDSLIYAFTKEALLTHRGLAYTEKTYAYITPPGCSIDIDTEEDFARADLILQRALDCRDILP